MNISAAHACSQPSASAYDHRPTSNKAPNRLLDALDNLVTSNLSRSALLVAIDALSRLTRTNRSTEAVPLAWTAERLKIHRNSVSNAYSELAARGFLRRTAVLHRGAPTRTTLTGIAKSKATGQQAHKGRPHSFSGEGADKSVETLGPSGPDFKSGPRIPPKMPDKHSDHAPQPVTDAVVSQLTETHARPAFVYDRHIDASMAKKVPAEYLAETPYLSSQSQLTIKPEWGLTPDELEHYRRRVPPRTERPVAATRPQDKRNASVRPMLSRPIAQSAWEALPVLENMAGAKRAGQLVDQIAFAIATTNLGRGDHAGGVRAALSLIRQGKWSAPRGMSSSWSGAVFRALQSARA